jgi:hypothetical protein
MFRVDLFHAVIATFWPILLGEKIIRARSFRAQAPASPSMIPVSNGRWL